MTLETSKKHMEKTQTRFCELLNTSSSYENLKLNHVVKINKLAGHNFKRDFEKKYNGTKIEGENLDGNRYSFDFDSVNFLNDYGTYEVNFVKKIRTTSDQHYLKARSYEGDNKEKLTQFDYDDRWHNNEELSGEFKLTEDSKKTLVDMLSLNY